MSQENVEVVPRAFEAWNAGDMDAVRGAFDPAAIMRTPEGWPEPGPFVGHDAVVHQLEQQRETWDSDSFELISDFIEAGEQVVVRWVWHGAGSGPEANLEMTAVYTVRKGRVFYVEHFWDHAEALEAAGLRERANGGHCRAGSWPGWRTGATRG